MYKLIFADDEALVRWNIVRMVPWEELGFTLLGCCSNGHELLDMIEIEQPDIVITDINMPFINGIEAARQIHQDYPGIQIVFLTGYNDFSYAQQAIEVQALKYILKPVTPQALFRELTDIKKRMDNDRERMRILPKMEKLQEKYKELMINLFFHQLLLSGMKQEEARRRLEDLGIEGLDGTGYRVAVLHELKNPQPDEDAMAEDLVQLVLLNIAKEHMKGKTIGKAVLLEKYIVLIFVKKSETPKDFQDAADQCAGEILSEATNRLKSTLFIGIGRIYSTLSDVAYSYAEAVSALGYQKSLHGPNHILRIEDIRPRREPEMFTESHVFLLTEAVVSGDSEKVTEAVRHLFSVIKDANPETVQIYLLSAILELMKEAGHMGIHMGEVISSRNLWKMMEITEKGRLEESFIKVCTDLSYKFTETQNKNYSEAVGKAKQYVDKNYSNPELSAAMVSEYLHLSPSYFRSLFKKEVGLPFGSYLINLRMDKAKNLLETTDKKVYEITEAIGFTNPHYFSYCFKQHFNMTPNELREARQKST